MVLFKYKGRNGNKKGIQIYRQFRQIYFPTAVEIIIAPDKALFNPSHAE